MSTGLTVRNSQFPETVLTHVFSDLRADEPSLRNLRTCALTCKAWLEPSRRLLHESVHIEPSPRSLKQLSEIYSSPDIAQYVRAATLTLAGWPRTDATVLHDNQDLLSSLFKHFTHLERINLQNLGWGTLSSETVHLLLGLTQLTALSLHNVTFDSNVQFESTILAFPNLSSLSIDGVRWSENFAFPPMDPAKDMTLPLRSLRLGKCTSQYALAERLLCYDFALQKFDVKWEDFRETKPIREILRASRDHLREFSVDLPQIVLAQSAEEVSKYQSIFALLRIQLFMILKICHSSYFDFAGHLEEDFSLSNNPNLRYLHFHSLFLDAHPTEAFHVSWVYGPLAQASPNTLRQVTFDVFADGIPSLSRFQWDCISHLLSAEKFPNAPNVEVNAHIMVDEDKDQGQTTNESVVRYLKNHLVLLGGERVVIRPDVLG